MALSTDISSPRFSPDNNAYWAETHEVYKQPPELENYNAYFQDRAQCDTVAAQVARAATDYLMSQPVTVVLSP